MINYGDVALTIFLLVVVVLGFLFELMGETAIDPRWHTISWWANRNKWLRWAILVIGFALLLWLVFVHFPNTHIAR